MSLAVALTRASEGVAAPLVTVEEGVARFVEWYRGYYGIASDDASIGQAAEPVGA